MEFYVLVIAVTWLVFILIVRFMNYPSGGTDHACYYRLTTYIKNNHHRLFMRFNDYIPLSLYPQGYFVICSFLSKKTLLHNPNFINYVVMFSVVIILNAFVCLISDFSYIQIILINSIFITLPIMYAVWNAKFMGLSARAFGIFLVYLYLFSFYFYLIGESGLIAFLLIIIFSFLCLLSSQFAFQFVIFSCIFVALVTFHFEVLLLIPLDIVLLFAVNFSYAKNFFTSQFHHKRNYLKFMIKGCHFQLRYSIWRDFVYDFWKKQDKAYVLGNPVVEVIIGAMPNCIVLVYFPFSEMLNDYHTYTLYVLLATSFFAFWITSLRIGRFLGEPQRYIEFGIPFASILSVMVFPSWLVVIFLFVNIFVLWWYAKNSQHHRQLPEHIKIREELIRYVNSIFNLEFCHLLSNDNEIARYFYVSNYDPHVPNYCRYYQNEEEFLWSYYKGDYHRISPQFLASEMKKYKKGILILYTNMLKFYDESEILPLIDAMHIEHLRTIGKFKIFKFYKEKEL
ncbi:hypothetical protein [Helicobacter sp.]|uniref:hypothetical protein n=1 Tax=Helicobacter sp. TaxID=218 RepID=UPI00258F2D86|nr:hypothetical protein [Helicobacter sp.]MCI7765126.1 hypothetical protein [Helicobacter sp.]